LVPSKKPIEIKKPPVIASKTLRIKGGRAIALRAEIVAKAYPVRTIVSTQIALIPRRKN
jgi:hypothetical protein